MKKTFSNFTFLLLTASVALTTACSSGEDSTATTATTFSGNTTPAAIDATNAEAIGTSAGEAIQIADASIGLPLGVSIGSSVDMAQLNALVLATVNRSNLPAGIDISSEVCSSGKATSTDPGSVTSGPIDIVATFNTCVFIGVGSDITVSGIVTIHFNDIDNPDAGFKITYTNFTVTDPVNGTTTINLTVECTDSLNCTTNSDFISSDGSTHRVSNFSVSGNASTGFNGSATFFHSTYGEVSIVFSGITYGSCGAHPDGGNISFSSTTGTSGTITFNGDCSVSGTWDNGVTSGSF